MQRDTLESCKTAFSNKLKVISLIDSQEQESIWLTANHNIKKQISFCNCIDEKWKFSPWMLGQKQINNLYFHLHCLQSNKNISFLLL
jgi:hypothetical protein